MISLPSPPLTSIIIAIVLHCCFLNNTVLAHEGWGIVVDQQGQIYFSDIPTNTIWKISPDGTLETVIRKHSHALVLRENGSIYGTQEHHASAVGSVWRIAPDGTFSNFFTPARNFPVSLHPFIIDSNDNVYSTNSISFLNQSDKVMLLKSSPDGNITIVAGGIRGHQDGQSSEAKFSGIDGMAWAPDGSLYVTDSIYVRRVTMDGIVTTLGKGALTSTSWGEDLMGLAVSLSGSVYVADYSRRRVVQLLPDGNTRTTAITGLIWSPTGITIEREDLYVLEHLRMPLVILGNIGIGPYVRIRKVFPDGRVTTIKTIWGRNTLIFAIALVAISVLSIFVWRWWWRRKTRHSLLT
ncbi:MAG: SMP-30/gluconolactonase/LRE family protein [Segetibacter sp.]